MMAVHIPQFLCYLLVPFERGRSEVEPCIHADSDEHIHIKSICFSHYGLQRVLAGDFHPAGVKLRRVEGLSRIALHGQFVLTYVFLISEHLLYDYRIHADRMHGTHHFLPVFGVHLLDVLVPMQTFLLAPMVEAYPCALYELCGPFVGLKHIEAFLPDCRFLAVIGDHDYAVFAFQVGCRYAELSVSCLIGLEIEDFLMQKRLLGYFIEIYRNKRLVSLG